MIRHLTIRHFKALRNVSIPFSPISVLIGPNDSGKTSVLQSVEALCSSAELDLQNCFTGNWVDQELVWRQDRSKFVTFEADISEERTALNYSLALDFKQGKDVRVIEESYADTSVSPARSFNLPQSKNKRVTAINLSQSADLPKNQQEGLSTIRRTLRGVSLARWNPSFLALPTAADLSRGEDPTIDASGFGLASCLDYLLGYDRHLFAELEDRFRKIFPQIERIQVLPQQGYRANFDPSMPVPLLQRGDGKGIAFITKSYNKPVPASQVSDGLIIVLAYLTLLKLPNPPSMLLIEEPENGIHPKRLKDILSIFKDLVEENAGTQVLLTTHSPYVVDLFKPEDVNVCTKNKEGEVTVTNLANSELVTSQKDIFTLGEIWTAEGDRAIADSKI